MLSQFTPEHKKKCLADLNFDFPKNVYPVGRLDENSEGLLILSDDKKLNLALLKPSNKHERAYHAQLQGYITPEAINTLMTGVTIRHNDIYYNTLPCKAKVIPSPKNLAPRAHPVKEELPTSWIELTLTEGKNRQVRRMTAQVGFPTQRLLRVRIEDLHLENMQPGEVRLMKREQVYKKLKLETL